MEDQTDLEYKFENPNEAWGEQTKNSLKYFDIGDDLFDLNFVKALIEVKKSYAHANEVNGKLDKAESFVIQRVCNQLLEQLDDARDLFPVKIWQTGSGTQINMNVNEVIAHYANLLPQSKEKDLNIHPNDHVNMSQSSNDVVPAALNISSLVLLKSKLIPAIKNLRKVFEKKEKEFDKVLKLGRTHLMDALPINAGKEISAFGSQIDFFIKELDKIEFKLTNLPLGATAVGSGVNCPPKVISDVISILKSDYDIEFHQMENLYQGTSFNTYVVELSACLKNFCHSLTKIVTDISFLASGPDSGLNEISIPANEAGSSIMPGKVNPTQCEALLMVCCEVIGNDLSISLGEMQGHFQLNTFRPLMVKDMHESLNLLSDSLNSFSQYFLENISANKDTMEANFTSSKMLVTLFSQKIGYDEASKIVDRAIENKTTVKDELISSGLISNEEFNNKMNELKELS